MGCVYLFESVFWYPLGKYLIVQLLVVLFLTFWGTSILLSRVAVPICIPTNSARGFPFLQSSPTFVVSCLINFCHSHWCQVVSYCGIDFYFPDGKWCGAYFHVLVGHEFVFIGEISVHIEVHLLNHVFCLWGISQWKKMLFIYTWKSTVTAE